LKQSLEELNLSYSELRIAQFYELKLMPKLKVFNGRHLKKNKIAILKNDLPHLKINEESINAA